MTITRNLLALPVLAAAPLANADEIIMQIQSKTSGPFASEQTKGGIGLRERRYAAEVPTAPTGETRGARIPRPEGPCCSTALSSSTRASGPSRAKRSVQLSPAPSTEPRPALTSRLPKP